MNVDLFRIGYCFSTLRNDRLFVGKMFSISITIIIIYRIETTRRTSRYARKGRKSYK